MGFRPGWMLAAVVVLAVLGVWFFSDVEPRAPGVQAPSTPAASGPAPTAPDLPPAASADCRRPAGFTRAAAANAASLRTLAWAPFGRQETGWEIYAPWVGREIGSRCGPADPGFAAAVARWQQANSMPADGVLTPAAFDVMRIASHRRRPFVAAFAQGCPPAADPAALAPASPQEGYGGKEIHLRRDVLAAYRAMVAAARREVPAMRADPQLLTIVSGYRSPEEAEADCVGTDCSGPARVLCSAHRTGEAVDLYVGHLPSSGPASTEDANRLHQSRNPAYLWLVWNAARFGFTPYIFEPWHWEWTGPQS